MSLPFCTSAKCTHKVGGKKIVKKWYGTFMTHSPVLHKQSSTFIFAGYLIFFCQGFFQDLFLDHLQIFPFSSWKDLQYFEKLERPLR